MNTLELKEKIFKIKDENSFNKMALQIFEYQYNNNVVYQKYVDYLGLNYKKIDSIYKIPFLPIEFFKTKAVISFDEKYKKQCKIFKSSGTTTFIRSTHYIYDIQLYEKTFLAGFEKFFGNPKQYTIIALLPSYIETGQSSLVYMVNKLIELSNDDNSGFFLNKLSGLKDLLINLDKTNKKIILWGVSYALLDLAEIINYEFKNLYIIETGGMKGRRKELTREELHNILRKKFGVKQIYSEYGMTELLSQAYLTKENVFYPASTMKILIRDLNDPFTYVPQGRTGGINIIDLANIYTCSFIETKDLGKINSNGFEILGRFDNSDIRGCNLLVD